MPKCAMLYIRVPYKVMTTSLRLISKQKELEYVSISDGSQRVLSPRRNRYRSGDSSACLS